MPNTHTFQSLRQMELAEDKRSVQAQSEIKKSWRAYANHLTSLIPDKIWMLALSQGFCTTGGGGNNHKAASHDFIDWLKRLSREPNTTKYAGRESLASTGFQNNGHAVIGFDILAKAWKNHINVQTEYFDYDGKSAPGAGLQVTFSMIGTKQEQDETPAP